MSKIPSPPLSKWRVKLGVLEVVFFTVPGEILYTFVNFLFDIFWNRINLTYVCIAAYQCVLSTTLKFVNEIGPNYLNEVFRWAAESNRTLRNDYRKLKHPFRKTTAGQNLLSFLGPSK